MNYPDATLDESRTYYADGALQTLTRGPGTANELRWEYQYNRRRLMTEARAHLGGQSAAMNWNYDAIGNVAGEYALNGVWTTYSPNAFGQPTLVKDPDNGRVYAYAISWFPNGALAGFTYGNGVVHTLTKNARDLPWRSQDMNGGAPVIDHTYTYDENGNPTVIDDALNLDDKAFGYDLLDRLTSASGGYGTATLAYDALDNLMRYSLPSRDWYYDTNPTTQRLERTRTAGYVAQVSLGYDTRGNVLTRTQAGATQGFTYDLADRVLTTTRNGVLQATHVYDGNGLRTRTSKPAPGAPQPDRDLRFQIYTPGGVFQWENDIECSQLRSRGVNYVRLAGSLLAKVVANSTLTQAECYPGTSNSEQQVLSINPFRNPFTGATEVVAGNDGGRDGEAPSAPTSTSTYSIVYVHTDALGSPVAETNINATVIPGSRTQYEPYGKPLTTPREGAPSYTGHQYDTSTGLIYAQQRYYDPALGRFLSTDPMAVDMGAAGNWNRYAYAANSPYRFTDPDGRQVCNGNLMCEERRDEAQRRGQFPLQAGKNEADEIAAEVHHNFIGRQAAPAGQVADGASAIADVVDDQAMSTAKTWWMGPLGGLLRFRGLVRSAANVRAATKPSRALGRSLVAAGSVRPLGSAAHHIVAVGAARAAPARAVLDRFGIGINDAANGVFLPTGVHGSIHTNAYYETVNHALSQATTRQEALQVLDAIRGGLL